MSEKPIRRDQENIHFDARSPLASQVSHHRRDIRLFENRILQETPQMVHPNAFLLKSQGRNQEYTTSPNNAMQLEKTNGDKIFQKASDNELRQILKESTSPAASAGINDISYRIVNEILNTQGEGRSHLKTKQAGRLADRKKNPLVTGQLSEIENVVETPKESKLVFEENEELKRLEKKIFDTKRQLDTRKGLVENGKVKLETEPKSLEEREQKLREDIVIVKQRIEERARVKSQTKEKPNMNPAKERLRQLKSELQHYEKELSNLKRHIEKQEKDWNEIEESVMENYKTQIQEFEEAIVSIEEQKMGIYEKLNEAARAHNENLEQKAMLKEDLSSRLLQRADLVGQREELEQAIESFRRNNRVEVEFCYFEKQTKQEIAPLDSDIQDLQSKAQSLKQQLDALNKANERDIDKEARVMHLQLLKNSWRDLCLFEVDLSNKADTFGLPSLVECYSNVLDTYEVQFNDPQQLWDYMQDVLEQEEDDETLIEELRMRENIRKETLDIWADQIADLLGKAGENDEEREVIIMYERYCELVNHLDEIFEKKDKLKNEENQTEEYKEVNLLFRQVQDELQDKELQREELKRKIEQKRDELEIDCEREAEVAFQAYVEQHSSVFELIQNESGVEVADIARQEHHQEFIQIARDNLADRLEHFREMQEEVKHLEQIIKSNTEIVDLKVLPLIQDLLPTLEEGAVLNSALKQQQMLLLETEDEVSGQLNLVLESRNDQLQQLYDKYTSSLMHSTSELREARDMLESKCKVLNEEASHLENSIMEVDKLATEELFEERKLQKELRDIEVELHNIETVQKPSLHALPVKLEVWDKEIKELEKVMEKLEMQRLGLEQQFIEQNYLGEEVSYHSNTSASMANEKSGKILNYESKESKNSEIQGSAANSFVKGLKNRDIQGLTDIEAIAPENFDLSPIGRTSMSPKHRRNNKEQNLFVEGNAISSQPESTVGKDHLSNWNCFSPPNSALLLGSGKGKGKTSGSKEKRRAGAEEGRKEESSYLKNYQKRREQKQNAGRHELPRSSTSVSLDTRTKSLPQTSIPNANYNPISKRIEDAGFFTQHTSPKVNETLNRPPSGQNSRDFNSTQNLDKRYFSKELGDSGRRMPNNGLELEEGTNMFTPKELNLHIDSLKAQAHPYAAMKSVPQEDLRYKELVGRNGELPGEDLAREFFVEGDDTEAMYSHQGKPLSVETSLHSTEIGGRFSGKGPKSGVEAEMTTKRIYQNLHGIMGAVRRGLADSEETGSQEDISRSKSTGVQGRLNVRFGAHVSDKLSSRDREERSQGKLETVASRGNTDFLRSLGSPLGRTGGKNYDYREALNDLKGRTIGGDHTIHEAVFFETVKPLLQGSLVYKKFTNYQSLKRAEFDPLMGDLYPPEVCGYGVRSLKLHPNLDRIEVKHTSKASVELSIPIESILRAVVPQITMDILRVQKRIVESQHISGHFDDKISIADIFGDISTKALLAKRGVNSLNNGMERYLNCSYYSFSILLEKNGKVEFVTSRYNTFKEWIHGINVLLKHKKQLSKLKDKVDKF